MLLMLSMDFHWGYACVESIHCYCVGNDDVVAAAVVVADDDAAGDGGDDDDSNADSDNDGEERHSNTHTTIDVVHFQMMVVTSSSDEVNRMIGNLTENQFNYQFVKCLSIFERNAFFTKFSF